jgi:hypothetical protein
LELLRYPTKYADHHSIQLTEVDGTRLKLDQIEESTGMNNIGQVTNDNDSEEKIETDGFISYKQYYVSLDFVAFRLDSIYIILQFLYFLKFDR